MSDQITQQSIITAILLSSKEQNELFAALAKAQGQFKVAAFDEANPHFKSKFASYAALVAATRPALAANGLSVNHKTVTDIDGKQYMITKLMHGSGQFDASLVPLRPDKKMDIQGFGSERSYQMRYSYKEILGIAAHDEEDDDGESAVGRVHKQISTTNNDLPSGNGINQDQVQTILNALNGFDNQAWLKARILEFNKVGSIEQLLQSRYQSVLKFILDNGK